MKPEDYLWLAYIEQTDLIENKYKRRLRLYFSLMKKRVLRHLNEQGKFYDFVNQVWLYDWDLEKQILLKIFDRFSKEAFQIGILRADKDAHIKLVDVFLYELERLRLKIIEEVINIIISTSQKHFLNLELEGITVEKIAELFERYMTDRTDTIARTETIRFSNLAYLQTSAFYGFTKKTWLTGLDENVCPVCSKLNGETRLITQSFSIGVQYPPAHPNCRCTIIVKTLDNRQPQLERQLIDKYLQLPGYEAIQNAVNIYLPVREIQKIKELIKEYKLRKAKLEKFVVFEKISNEIIFDEEQSNKLNKQQLANAFYLLLVDKNKDCENINELELNKEELFHWAYNQCEVINE